MDSLAHVGQIGEGSPKLAEKFFDYYKSVFEGRALSSREKVLIALAVASAQKQIETAEERLMPECS